MNFIAHTALAVVLGSLSAAVTACPPGVEGVVISGSASIAAGECRNCGNVIRSGLRIGPEACVQARVGLRPTGTTEPDLPAMRLRCWQHGVGVVDEVVADSAPIPGRLVLARERERVALLDAGHALCLLTPADAAVPKARGPVVQSSRVPQAPRVDDAGDR